MLRAVPPHASRGGSRGYHPEHRTDALRIDAYGLGHLATPSEASRYRWRRNGIIPLQKTGGVVASNMRGEHTYLLVLYRMVYPKAQADEIIAFIVNNATFPQIYSRADISKREKELGYTRKRANTEALQAELPINQLKRHMFWTMSYPYGVLGTPRANLIDTDECGIWLDYTNRTYGKALTGVSVREAGKYNRTGEKWTLILSVDCNRVVGFRFRKVSGTTTDEFVSFLRNDVFPNLPTGGPQRTFLWDNLGAHLNSTVHNLVTGAGHRVLCRAPYMPSDGPIEYVFNQVDVHLKKLQDKVMTDTDLVTAMTTVLSNISGLDATFVHCGYA